MCETVLTYLRYNVLLTISRVQCAAYCISGTMCCLLYLRYNELLTYLRYNVLLTVSRVQCATLCGIVWEGRGPQCHHRQGREAGRGMGHAQPATGAAPQTPQSRVAH